MIIERDTDMTGFEHLNTEYSKVTEPTDEEWDEKWHEYIQLAEEKAYFQAMCSCKTAWDATSLSFFPEDDVEIKEITDEII